MPLLPARENALQDINWQFVIDEHGPVVWKRAYQMLGNDADAQDCFQETFLSALRLLEKQHIKNFRALLTKLATLRAIDIFRKRLREKNINEGKDELSNLANKNPGPPIQVQRRRLAAMLRDELAQIPPKQAQAFCLKYFDDMSYRQIARQLKIKKGTVGMLLYRAREKIRNDLQKKL